MPIKKYCDYYYQVIKVGNSFGWNIYNSIFKNRELLESHKELCDTQAEAEQDARDAISYHYD